MQEGYLLLEVTAVDWVLSPSLRWPWIGPFSVSLNHPRNRENFRLPPEIADIQVENSQLAISFAR